MKTRAGGSSGTAAITWAGGAPMMSGRSNAGGRCAGILHRFETTVHVVPWIAGPSSVRPFFIGPTTRGRSRTLFSFHQFTLGHVRRHDGVPDIQLTLDGDLLFIINFLK